MFVSCGYVSFIQLLSYYDTFYNDEIIPEVYDRSANDKTTWGDAIQCSPGVYKGQTLYPFSSISEVLYYYVNQCLDNDFQAKLMWIVNTYLGTNNSENFSGSIGYYDDLNLYGVERYQLILNYFETLRPTIFNRVKYSDAGNNLTPESPLVRLYMESYIKQLLENNIPVLVYLRYTDDNEIIQNHSVVAYYYDDDGIHANFGWEYDWSPDKPITNEYNYVSFCYLDMSQIEEVHSNNYIVSGISHCGCEMPHFHVYDENHVYFNSTYHKSYCTCGNYSLHAHGIKEGSTYIRNGHTYGICRDCNSTIDLGTGFIII